jgi:hypothetical protein
MSIWKPAGDSVGDFCLQQRSLIARILLRIPVATMFRLFLWNGCIIISDSMGGILLAALQALLIGKATIKGTRESKNGVQ